MKKENNSTDVTTNLNNLAKNLDLGNGEETTLLEIENTDDPNIKKLHLKKGSWESNNPWLAVDKNDEKKIYAFVPVDILSKALNTSREVQQENFNLKLEKTIWQNIPIDFEDVRIVAMDEIKKLAAKQKDKTVVSVNLEQLIQKIKSEHPNLFLNIKELYPQLNN